MILRREEPEDRPAIRSLLEAAFPTEAESRLVDGLRSDEDAVVSIVAVVSGSVVGHAMLSRMAAPFRALGLAPVAVAPSHQRRGIGSALVNFALNAAEMEGWRAVFVLGDPAFYGRFGFSASSAEGFTSPYAGPHLMVLAFDPPLPISTGRIDYAPAFAELG